MIARRCKNSTSPEPTYFTDQIIYPENGGIGKFITKVDIFVRQTTYYGSVFFRGIDFEDRHMNLTLNAHETTCFNYTATIYGMDKELQDFDD